MSKTVSIIKQLRNAGLSQSEIARRTGVSQTRISRWESGRVGDAADAVLRLKELLESLQLSTPIVAVDGQAEQGA